MSESLSPDETDLPVDDVEIVAPDLDVEAVMKQIRARLRERRALAKAQGLDFEAYAEGLYPLPRDAVLGRAVHEAARHMGLDYDKIQVELVLTETSLPLIGRLVQRLRSAMHGLVLFYVNRLGARQVRFNEQVARAVVSLVRDLEAEITDLRTRLAALEGSSAEKPAHTSHPPAPCDGGAPSASGATDVLCRE